MSNSRPQVLILGTYHMANNNRDHFQTDYTDVRTGTRPQEIQELVQRLKAFAPTCVAVEIEPARMPDVQEQYLRYRAGTYTLGPNEIDQLALRLAAELGHRELAAIDYKLDLDMDGVFDAIPRCGLTAALAPTLQTLAEVNQESNRLEQQCVLDALRYMNTPEFDQKVHSGYMHLVAVGAQDTYVGAAMVADWYTRNLRIFANICHLAQNLTDRILVLIGAGHCALLRQFVREAPQLELVEALPYLK